MELMVTENLPLIRRCQAAVVKLIYELEVFSLAVSAMNICATSVVAVCFCSHGGRRLDQELET